MKRHDSFPNKLKKIINFLSLQTNVCRQRQKGKYNVVDYREF